MTGEPTTGRLRPVKRRITVGLAVALAFVALVAGVAIGYVARGGPAEGGLVTNEQELPIVTVTVPEGAEP